MREVINEDEKKKLAALEMKQALGGVDEDEEEELADLRKRKKLQQAINKSNS